MGGSWGRLGQRSGCCASLTPRREREGGLGRIFPDYFPREFGKAVGESLNKSRLSGEFCVSQEQGRLSFPAMLSHCLGATPMVSVASVYHWISEHSCWGPWSVSYVPCGWRSVRHILMVAFR